jgi:hypothetical protein
MPRSHKPAGHLLLKKKFQQENTIRGDTFTYLHVSEVVFVGNTFSYEDNVTVKCGSDQSIRSVYYELVSANRRCLVADGPTDGQGGHVKEAFYEDKHNRRMIHKRVSNTII